ncbi:MAG: glycine cleavage system protein GcvH [Gemmataceae bacterium]
MEFRQNVKYTPDHEWVSAEGLVGITDYAQDALGDVVFVELPEVGQNLKAGDPFGVVESVKSVSDLYSPLNGTVVRVNAALTQTPELINQDPYGQGWIIQIEAVGMVDGLMDAEAYRLQVEGE